VRARRSSRTQRRGAGVDDRRDTQFGRDVRLDDSWLVLDGAVGFVLNDKLGFIVNDTVGIVVHDSAGLEHVVRFLDDRATAVVRVVWIVEHEPQLWCGQYGGTEQLRPERIDGCRCAVSSGNGAVHAVDPVSVAHTAVRELDDARHHARRDVQHAEYPQLVRHFVDASEVDLESRQPDTVSGCRPHGDSGRQQLL